MAEPTCGKAGVKGGGERYRACDGGSSGVTRPLAARRPRGVGASAPVPLSTRRGHRVSSPVCSMDGPGEGGSTIPRKLDIPATLCLLGATLCWGIAPVMLKYLSHADRVPDGFTSNFVRYPVGTVVYLPLLIHAIRRGNLGGFWVAALIPTAVNIVGQTLWAWAFFHLDAGMIAFLIRLCVVWGILGAFWLFPDERQLARSPRFWMGTGLALGGFTIMSLKGISTSSGTEMIGIVIMLFCSMFWGMYGVSVRYVMRDLNPFVVFGVVGSYTSMGLVLMAPLGAPASVIQLKAIPLVLLVLSALIGITAAHGLYYVAVQRIGVAVSALTLTATPFVSLLVSCLLLGERFSPGGWVGGVILIVGSTLALWSQQHLSPPPVPDPHEIGTE